MVRVTDVEQSIHFNRDGLGLEEILRTENEKGRYTLIFLAPPGQHDMPVELPTTGIRKCAAAAGTSAIWPYEVDDIYAFCSKMRGMGYVINRPPRDGNMAFVRSTDNVSVEILHKGSPLPPAEPW